ncbi:MAG: hypothetical protein EAZ53_11115 [Bacteroidetes bacterium]|nr:MAG: hypothetical protein EAZ53_11115 [Bacteroidota bacterium]
MKKVHVIIVILMCLKCFFLFLKTPAHSSFYFYGFSYIVLAIIAFYIAININTAKLYSLLPFLFIVFVLLAFYLSFQRELAETNLYPLIANTGFIDLNYFKIIIQYKYALIIVYLLVYLVLEDSQVLKSTSIIGKAFIFSIKYQIGFLVFLWFSSPIAIVGLMSLQLFVISKSRAIWKGKKLSYYLTTLGSTLFAIWNLVQAQMTFIYTINNSLQTKSYLSSLPIFVLLLIVIYQLFFNPELKKVPFLNMLQFQTFALAVIVMYLGSVLEEIFYVYNENSQIILGSFIFGHSFTIICFGFLYGICCNTKFKSFTNNYQL